MRVYPYLIKIRQLVLIVTLSILCNFTVAYADSGYNVILRIINAHEAEIKLVYPVSPEVTVISALSSKKGGNMLDGHRDLVSANAEDGSPRVITNNTPTTDSQITVQPGDQKITLTYKLTNTLSTDEVSLFNFLLFLGTEYSTTAHIKITVPVNYEILSHSGNVNTARFSDGSLTTDINTDQSASFLSAKNLTVLVYPKPSSAYYRKDIGNFTLVGTTNKISEVRFALERISFAPEMFRKILGVSLPDKVSIVIVPISEDAQAYEPSGRALPPNIILVDPNELNFNKGPYDSEKIILHELGHLALSNKGIFSNQLYNARWFDEGIAVFGEQYATDNYFLKDENLRQQDTVLSDFRKMTLAELSLAYKLSFDYDFSINTKEHPIDYTYAHAGLILYNLYIRDATIIPRLLNSLRTAQSNFTCQSCDTNTILNNIQNISSLPKDDIIYPFKNNLSAGNQTISRLTIQNVDENMRQKIKEEASKALGSYINKDAPAESFTVPENTSKITKISDTTTTSENLKENEGQNKNELPSDQVEQENVQEEERVSFWVIIWRWFINLFK